MTKRIFRSIFFTALAVFAAAMVLILGVLYSYFTRIQLSQLQEEAALVAQNAAREGLAYFDEESRISNRITWIAPDGTVLYDSRSNSSDMENHLSREEVTQALQTGQGQSTRYSSTLMERYLYAAQRLPDGSVLRLSASRSSVLKLGLGMSQYIFLAVILTIVLSACLASHLAREVVKPINGIDLDEPMSNREYEEILPLLKRLEAQQIRLRAQDMELSQKRREFEAVTRSLEEGLVLMNASGTILSINPAAVRLLSVTPNCLGADFSVASRDPEISALVEKTLTGQKGEITVSLGGSAYLAAASPVKSGETVSGVVLLLFDVTQKQRAEELRREFTANVSHELKTPLHAISGYAELMQSGLVPEADMSLFAQKIYAQTQRLSQLVEDTLRLSRLDDGAEDMEWTEVDLYQEAKNTIQSLASSAELNGICLSLEGSTAVVPGIQALVCAIVFNLTDNAIKYNRPGGSVTVTVLTEETEVLLRVADTGIGIPAEHQERVFERFYRVDKSHSREVGGTGLGLSIVKHAAKILNAQIHLTSAQNQGTVIEVHFLKNQ